MVWSLFVTYEGHFGLFTYEASAPCRRALGQKMVIESWARMTAPSNAMVRPGVSTLLRLHKDDMIIIAREALGLRTFSLCTLQKLHNSNAILWLL